MWSGSLHGNSSMASSSSKCGSGAPCRTSALPCLGIQGIGSSSSEASCGACTACASSCDTTCKRGNSSKMIPPVVFGRAGSAAATFAPEAISGLPAAVSLHHKRLDLANRVGLAKASCSAYCCRRFSIGFRARPSTIRFATTAWGPLLLGPRAIQSSVLARFLPCDLADNGVIGAAQAVAAPEVSRRCNAAVLHGSWCFLLLNLRNAR
mmetsp:Transcript_25859/g.59667  ORF Transcript_25859/g.59667 Transcript_25859/m.59667 type:complete len:208 (+) Transcript_25859:205-828(+)